MHYYRVDMRFIMQNYTYLSYHVDINLACGEQNHVTIQNVSRFHRYD